MEAADAVERSKSPNDQKKYRLVRLPNALSALLISTSEVERRAGAEQQGRDGDDDDDDEDMSDEDMSDEGEDGSEGESEDGDEDFGGEEEGGGAPSRRAGACLTVGVGSFADPENLPGLAHYLEHMVFMGSDKYPDENAFEAFLSSHGGFSNGATDNEVTSYTFEVGPKHLEQALDMFAQFFISPLMKADAMERELSAIESEFNQATQSDRVRTQQVLCDVSLPHHPYHRFGWGNKRSLLELPQQANIDVRQQILAFYNKFYSANVMKLVVCGEDSLDDLEKWVRASFSAIANKQISIPSYASFGAPIGAAAGTKPFLCRIVPIRDIHSLCLSWMVPPILGKHHQKPADYVASLLGHESEGSILSDLKSRGWISALTAGVTDTDGFDCGTYAARFDVTIKMTREGISRWVEIVQVVFEYLRVLRESGCPEWVFEELKALADISFRFQEESSAVEKCEELAEVMQDIFQVAPGDILRYDLFQGTFNKGLVLDLLHDLTADNVCLSLVSQLNAEDPAFEGKTVTEEWFGVKYSREDVSADTVARWRSAGVNAKLHLPMPNPFIPHDFSLVDTTSLPAETVSRETAFGKLWYKPDRAFATPRAHVGCFLQLPLLMERVENVVMTDLYAKLVRDALNEYAYHANVAELMYSLRVKEAGLELMFGGFNDKLHILVEVVVAALFSTEIKPARFEVLKEELLREYKNLTVKPSQKARHLRLQLLEQTAFPLAQSIATLEATTTDQLKEFVTTRLWSDKTFVASLAHGNVSPSAALGFVGLVEAQLSRASAARLAPAEMPRRNIMSIPETPAGFLLRERSDHKSEVNTHVEQYYQIGEHSLRHLAYADLLHQLMEEPLFDTLRTKQELGYDVSCTVRVTHGVLGFGVSVESSLFDAEYISGCVDQFLVDFEDAIAAMPEKHFRDHVQAQIMKKREPDHNLLETTHRLWYEISSRRLIFDVDELLIKELETSNREEMLHHYREWILENPKKLTAQIIGRSSAAEKRAHAKRKAVAAAASTEPSSSTMQPVRIRDLYQFKAQLPFYPDKRSLEEAKGGEAQLAPPQGAGPTMEL